MFVRQIDKAPVPGVTIANASEDLPSIKRPACAAVIWRRQPTADFQSWLDALAPDQLPNGRMVLRPQTVPDAITQLCEVAHTPHCAARVQLVDGVSALAEIFARLMRAPYLRLRLQAVTTNACRKFHVDAMTARLICTYRGTGTQYGHSRNGHDPARVFTASTGSAVLLRGSFWPQNPDCGLVHRSPPIEGTGETRLVLVLDPVLDLEDET